MTEYDQLLDKYASEFYLLYSSNLSEKEWGNKEIALSYLKKYHLFEDEHQKIWKPIQNSIFKNLDKSLPEMMFSEDFSFLATIGGVLFDQKEFLRLQSCILKLGDTRIVIIQNDFGGEIETPLLRLSFPSDISWEELMSGNFISTVIFEMFTNEYFVFSESGKWGKYSAIDYEHPLDIYGFMPQYESFFRDSFKQSKKELEEVKNYLPPNYR